MNSYKATKHNPPLTHADVKVSVGRISEESQGESESSESKKKKQKEKSQGID